MGTVATEDFFSRHRRRAGRRHHDDHRLLHPEPAAEPDRRLEQWPEWAQEGLRRLLLPRRDHLVVGQRRRSRWPRDRTAASTASSTSWRTRAPSWSTTRSCSKASRRCRELGALPLVHAENGEAVFLLQQQLLAHGITGPEGHALSRPPEVEGEAANRAIMIAADHRRAALHRAHLLPARRTTRSRGRAPNGQRVFGEPLAQHLRSTTASISSTDWEYAAARVMSPPFRSKEHQKALWDGLTSGSLQVVGDRPLLLHARAEEDGHRQLHA